MNLLGRFILCLSWLVSVSSLTADEVLVTLAGVDMPVAVEAFMPGSQDVGGLATVSPDQRSVTLSGNAWKRLPLTYTVTPNTYLEFDFSSTHLAEIYEVRLLDADSYYTSSINFIHYLGGTQYGGGPYTAVGTTLHVIVHVGAKVQGAITNLELTHDNDANDPLANGTWSNLKLYEYVPPSAVTIDLDGTPTSVPILSFMPGVQDLGGPITVADGAVTLTGNTWKRLPLTYAVTPDTVLEFTFGSTHLAEIHEVRLLNAVDYNAATINYIFDLGGTQYGGGNYSQLGNTQAFRVAVGKVFQGSITNLVLTNDNDAFDPLANGTFAAIRLYEDPDHNLTIEANGVDQVMPVAPFMPGRQDVSGALTISSDRRSATLTGNAWKCLEVDYDITPYTVLEFEFATAHPGEYHEIRLLSGEDYLTSTTNWIYGLCGSETSIRNYTGGGAVQHYILPVGQTLAGVHARRLVLVNDNDANDPAVTSTYGNIRLREYRGGLLADFFDFTVALSVIPDLEGLVPGVSRIDAQVNYASTNNVWTGLPTAMRDTFASRHAGFIKITTPGTYTLYLNSDDGSRLLLNGLQVIDNDGLHGLRERSASVTLTAGYHPILVEFFENGGGAGLIMSWSGPGFGKQVVPSSVLFHLEGNQPPSITAGDDQSLMLPDDLAILSGSASDRDGDPLMVTWSQTGGPAGVAFGDAQTLSTTATFPVAGVYSLLLSVSDGSITVTDTVVITVEPEPVFGAVVLAFNAGGGGFTADDGTLYQADTDASAGRSGGSTYSTGATTAIANTVDDTLYRSERYGSFTYAAPVTNGSYYLVLQFAEIYWTLAGRRVFDVTAEGGQVVDDLDIFVTAGGLNVAYDVIVPITINDGVLNLSFITGVDNAKLSAFRLVQHGINN